MTATSDPDAAAVQDARVLLGALLAGGWRELHVVSGGCEIFIALTGGNANPMRHRAACSQPLPASETGPTMLKAPHIATLTTIAAERDRVAKDDRLATIEVLGRVIPLNAPADCIVERCEAAVGALLEFEQPILSFRPLA